MAHATPSCSAFHVVTDASLLSRVVSFQRGLQRYLVKLARSPDVNRSSLPKYAIKRSNRRLLLQLFRYYTEQPEDCRSQPAMSFDGVWLCAVEENQLAIAQWIDAQPQLKCWVEQSEDCMAACTSESIVMFTYVMNRRPPVLDGLRESQVTQPFKTGSVELLEWLEKRVRVPHRVYMVAHAAKMGHLAIIKYLSAKIPWNWTIEAMDAAAGNGHLEVVEFLHENRTDGCSTKAMDSAAEHGHFDVLQFLHEKRTEGCTAKYILRLSTIS